MGLFSSAKTFNQFWNNTSFADSLRNWTYDVAGVNSDASPRTPSKPLTGLSGALSNYVKSKSNDIDNLQNFVDEARQTLSDTLIQDTNKGTPAVYPSDGGTAVVAPDYVNADLAKAYGMDTSTAYQEALSNTSYQRAAADLQAAGINPMLAVQGLSGASGVYSAHMAGDGSLSTGVSSAKGAHTFYNLFSNLGTAIGALTGGRTGSVAGRAIGTLLGNAFDNLG